MRKPKLATHLLLLLVGLCIWSGDALAIAKYAWVTGNWRTAGTWSSVSCAVAGATTVPTAADDVTICPGVTVTVNVNASALSVNVQGTGTLTQATNRTLTIGAGGLNVAGTLTSQNTLSVAGATSVSGTLAIATATGTKTFAGAVTINAGGVWNNSANEAVTFQGGLTNNGGTFTAGTGIYTFSTNAQAIGGTSPITIPNVTVTTIALTNNGNLTVSTALAGTGSLVNSATATLNIGGTATITTLNATAAGNTVNYYGAAQTAKVTTYSNLTLSGSGAKTFATTPTVNGVLSMEGAATVTVTTGVVTYGANATLQYNTATARTAAAEEWITPFAATGGIVIANTGVITMGAAKVLNASVPLTINSGATLATGAFQLTAGGDVSNSGTHTATTGSITLSGGAAVHTLSGNGTYANLILNDANGAALTGSPTVSGTLTLTSGTFAVGANTLTLNGPPIAGAPANLSTTSSSSLVFGGASAAVLVPASVGALNNLTVNNASGVTLSGSPTLSGTLTLTSGTLTVGANTLTLNGPPISGTATNLATSATSSLVFGGSAAGHFIPASVTALNNLAINNVNGVTLNSSPVLSGTLTLASGLVATGANTLEVASSCATGISGGSAGSFVLGNLGLHYPVNAGVTTCTFHIGDAASYTPVTVAMTNVSSALAGNLLTARTDAGDHADTTAGTSGIDPAKSVNRNWTLTPGGLLTFTSYDATFTFLNSDVDAGATPANFIVGRKSGAEWTYPTVGAANPTSTSATGITSAGGFGAFVIGEAKLVASALYAEWRMDEYQWNGTAGEVADNAGTNHGTAATLTPPPPTTANTSPAIAGDPGTCRYGVFDRTKKDYVALPAAFPNLGAANSFTITAWIRTTNNTLSGQRTFIDDESNTQGYGLSLGDGGTGTLRFYSRGTPSALTLDTPNVIANNAWYFIAAVADIPNKRKRIYVYNTAGTQLASVSATWTEASFGSDAGIASIGGETNVSGENSNAFGFAGNIDEVHVYQSALSAKHLEQVLQQTHACPAPPLDHISIEHASGQGVTCTPSTLTIKACQDAACSVLYTGGVTGTLTATGTPTVNWVGGTGFSIGGSGSTTKDVQVTTPGSVVFGTTGVAPAPAAATTCSFGSCTFTSSDSGLLFSVPHHASETLQNITVSAVKKADNSLACVPAFGNVSKNVVFTCSYTNPATGTLPVHVGGMALNAGNNPAAACDGTGQTLSLAFNASGVASTTLQYADVGNMALNAQYTGSGADAGLVMTGSASFIAAPASFAFSAITPAPIKAGTVFSATVTAKNSAGNTTPNFGQESAAESVTLTHTRYQPTGVGASNGTFSGNVGTFVGGAATASNLIWTEVGTIDLTATLASGSYLGSGLTAAGSTGAAGAVGPFVPHHFETVVTQGCSAGSFSYSGQPFTVEIRAMNGVIAPAVTVNYDGTAGTSPNFAKTVTLSDGNAAGVGTLAPATVAASAFAAGVATATPAYTFTSRQTSQTTIKLRAADADAGSSGFTEGTTDIRSGRAKLGNAHGSELLSLPVPFRTEYWTSNGWVLHSADSCTGDTTLGAGNAVSVTLSSPPSTCVQDNGSPGRSGAGCAAAGPVGQRFKEGGVAGFAGDFNLWLKAPGASNTGAVTVTGNVPSWLLYPWGGGADVNPAGRATFGVYKGANEFIYQRETY